MSENKQLNNNINQADAEKVLSRFEATISQMLFYNKTIVSVGYLWLFTAFSFIKNELPQGTAKCILLFTLISVILFMIVIIIDILDIQYKVWKTRAETNQIEKIRVFLKEMPKAVISLQGIALFICILSGLIAGIRLLYFYYILS